MASSSAQLPRRIVKVGVAGKQTVWVGSHLLLFIAPLSTTEQTHPKGLLPVGTTCYISPLVLLHFLNPYSIPPLVSYTSLIAGDATLDC